MSKIESSFLLRILSLFSELDKSEGMSAVVIVDEIKKEYKNHINLVRNMSVLKTFYRIDVYRDNKYEFEYLEKDSKGVTEALDAHYNDFDDGGIFEMRIRPIVMSEEAFNINLERIESI